MLLNVFLVSVLGVTVLLAFAVFHLWRICVRLGQEMCSAKVALNTFGNDLAGLCLAEASRDDKISDQGRLLHKLEERIQHLGHADRSSPAFHAAISAARQGADVARLMEDYGLTRDAAELVVRLHGVGFGYKG